MLVQVIDNGINLRYLYVDTVGDPERYRQKLEDLFPSLIVTVEKKADSKFPVVSAASICAKVSHHAPRLAPPSTGAAPR